MYGEDPQIQDKLTGPKRENTTTEVPSMPLRIVEAHLGPRTEKLSRLVLQPSQILHVTQRKTPVEQGTRHQKDIIRIMMADKLLCQRPVSQP